MSEWNNGPQITGLVVRQRGTNLYWSRNGTWDERLSEAKRWTHHHEMVACGRINNWPPSEQVWLGWKDRVLQVKPVDLR